MQQRDLIIRDLRARAVIAPLAQPIRTSVGTIPSAPLVLIDLSTNQGVTGRAYIFGYTPVTLRPLTELMVHIREMLVGKAVAPIERMQDFRSAFRLLGCQGLVGMAISGVEMAMWDAMGHAADLPVCALLGAEAKPVPAYASHGVLDPETDRALLEANLRDGFRAVKIKLGAGTLGEDVASVSGVRKIIGSETGLMVDYNQSLTVTEAKRRIAALSAFDLTWVEEPVPAEDLSGHREVRASSTVPIQTGENWWFPEDAARAIAGQASDLAMLDLMKIGGVSGWMRAAAQAEGVSLPVSSHLFVEASAHTLAATPNAHFLEYLDIAGAVMATPTVVENGAVSPRGPGLGIVWDARAIDAYAV